MPLPGPAVGDYLKPIRDAYKREKATMYSHYRKLTGQEPRALSASYEPAPEPDAAVITLDAPVPDNSWLKADILAWLVDRAPDKADLYEPLTKSELLAIVETTTQEA